MRSIFSRAPPPANKRINANHPPFCLFFFTHETSRCVERTRRGRRRFASVAFCRLLLWSRLLLPLPLMLLLSFVAAAHACLVSRPLVFLQRTAFANTLLHPLALPRRPSLPLFPLPPAGVPQQFRKRRLAARLKKGNVRAKFQEPWLSPPQPLPLPLPPMTAPVTIASPSPSCSTGVTITKSSA